MTLAITTLTPRGIILSADGRQTYRNLAGMVRIGSDNVRKIFKLSDRVGVAVAGRAFIADAGGNPKNVGYFIEEFKNQDIAPALPVREIAERLNGYLAGLFVAKELDILKAQITDSVARQAGTELEFEPSVGNTQPFSFRDKIGQNKKDQWFFETVELTVAGIDQDGVGRAYNVFVPTGITVEADMLKCGALWIGQGDVVARIMKGYDPVGGSNLPFVKEALNRDPVQVQTELAKLEYIVNWGTMTLQDAVDFNILITRTTESIQRFSDGTILNPGGITGVGGAISVAAILPGRGFTWIKKKQLSAEGSEIDVDW
jgi:hypothetical protein